MWKENKDRNKGERYFTKLKRRTQTQGEDAYVEVVLGVVGLIIIWILVTKIV